MRTHDYWVFLQHVGIIPVRTVSPYCGRNGGRCSTSTYRGENDVAVLTLDVDSESLTEQQVALFSTIEPVAIAEERQWKTNDTQEIITAFGQDELERGRLRSRDQANRNHHHADLPRLHGMHGFRTILSAGHATGSAAGSGTRRLRGLFFRQTELHERHLRHHVRFRFRRPDAGEEFGSYDDHRHRREPAAGHAPAAKESSSTSACPITVGGWGRPWCLLVRALTRMPARMFRCHRTPAVKSVARTYASYIAKTLHAASRA